MRLGSFLFQNSPITNVNVEDWFNKVMGELLMCNICVN